jgi:hypothetical protein
MQEQFGIKYLPMELTIIDYQLALTGRNAKQG